MSRRIARTTTNYFKNPLIEGKYKVIPPPPVPNHIIKPEYVTSSNPIFGEYDAKPVPHTAEAIQSISLSITRAQEGSIRGKQGSRRHQAFHFEQSREEIATNIVGHRSLCFQ
jgi:hypothetical protein